MSWQWQQPSEGVSKEDKDACPSRTRLLGQGYAVVVRVRIGWDMIRVRVGVRFLFV